jgi:hypothetical protein
VVGKPRHCRLHEAVGHNLMLKTKTVSILTAIFLLTLQGCSEKNTSKPKEAYKYWAYQNPDKEVQVLYGQYWESAHWSKEYIVYLKLKPTSNWWKQFLKQNNLNPDTTKWWKPEDAPLWFSPPKSSKTYSKDRFSNSRYFFDNLTGDCYIYEVQL